MSPGLSEVQLHSKNSAALSKQLPSMEAVLGFNRPQSAECGRSHRGIDEPTPPRLRKSNSQTVWRCPRPLKVISSQPSEILAVFSRGLASCRVKNEDKSRRVSPEGGRYHLKGEDTVVAHLHSLQNFLFSVQRNLWLRFSFPRPGATCRRRDTDHSTMVTGGTSD